MDDLWLQVLKSVATAVPVAVVLALALRWALNELKEAQKRIEELHKEKEALFERVLTVLKDLGG